MEQRLQQAAATLVPVRVEKLFTAESRRWKQVWKRRLALSVLIISDLAFALLVWYGAYALQGIFGQGQLSSASIVAVFPTVAVWIGLRALMGLYPGYGLDEVEQLRRHTYAVLATAGTMMVSATGFHIGDSLSRLLLALGFFGLLVLAPLARHLVKLELQRLGVWGKPIVVMGSGESGMRTTSLLQKECEIGYNPVAFLDYHLRLSNEEESSEDGGFDKESILANTVELSREWGVDTVIFAMPHIRREQLTELVGWASVNFRHVLITPNLGGMTNSAVVARNLAGTFAVEVKYNLLDPWALRLKRVLDIVLTLLGGLLVLPLLAVLCLLIYLESGSPVFYSDKRMGRNNRLFPCVKFRTMIPDAEAALQRLLENDPAAREEYQRYHKLRDDPRVTRVGRFLRKTSLDELPQLWNVLKGQMSLVGPRPYLPRESLDIGTTQSEILRVPPGITGPWQVSGRASTSFDHRVGMDAYYVRDWSVWLDIVLLVRTVKSVFVSKGAY